VRRAAKAVVHHAVTHCKRAFPQLRLNSPVELQVFTEDCGLGNHPFAPERAFVTLPRLSITSQPGGNIGHATVQARLDRGAMLIDVVRRRVGVHEQRVIEPTSLHEPGHGAQPGEPALALILVQPRVPKTGWRVPADGRAAELEGAYVHRPVHQHLELQPGSGPELQESYAPFQTVAEGAGLYARELQQRASPALDVKLAQLSPIQLGHARVLRCRNQAASISAGATTRRSTIDR
jgi:hypothetical protein